MHLHRALTATAFVAACLGFAWAQQPPVINAPPGVARPGGNAPAPITPLTTNAAPQIPAFYPELVGSTTTIDSQIAHNGPRFPERDHDGDGAVSAWHSGNDCDDGNASRHPAAIEVSDAAGTDEDCNSDTVGSRDSDRDGFLSPDSFNVLRNASGAVIGIKRGADCDDGDRTTNPNSPEVPGDGKDNDCDGSVDSPRSPGRYCRTGATVPAANPGACLPARS
jgi:hypothetical protein